MATSDLDNELSDLLVKSVYGPDMQPKADADVLELIHSLENGVARDLVLNAHISLDKLHSLALQEKEEEFSSEQEAQLAAIIRQLACKGHSFNEIKQCIPSEYSEIFSSMNTRDALRIRIIDLYNLLTEKLDACYPIIYIDIDNIKILTKATLTVEHPFYVMMALDTKGERKLLRVAQYPSNYKEAGVELQMWREALVDLKERGCTNPVYMVTGAINNFKEALREVFPFAIYQHSINDILEHSSMKCNTAERSVFNNEFKALYNAKSLLECMKALENLRERWDKSHPECIKYIKEHFIFFEQYFAANPALRPSIRSTKPISLLFNDMRRDFRQDRNYMYSDALCVLKRIMEMERYITRPIKPVQWKRALKSMLEDPYVCKLVNGFINPEDIKLSRG